VTGAHRHKSNDASAHLRDRDRPTLVKPLRKTGAQFVFGSADRHLDSGGTPASQPNPTDLPKVGRSITSDGGFNVVYGHAAVRPWIRALYTRRLRPPPISPRRSGRIGEVSGSNAGVKEAV